MLSKLKRTKLEKTDKGFTIIEVMIVLAIAGLILLIVFLAVPALQRNARNTQRKNDAAQYAAAIANFISNNGGTLPAGIAIDTNANTDDVCAVGGNTGTNAAASTPACSSGTNLETVKLGYYAQGALYMETAAQEGGTNMAPAAVGSAASETTVTSSTMTAVLGYGCNSSGNQLGTANSRDAAIFYVTENGGGGSAGSIQCVEQ